jgi:uncharacterized protein (TIGR00730 family)
LRILAEFLEPLSRLTHFGIKDTIVFFGSARIPSKSAARARLKEARGRQQAAGAVAPQAEIEAAERALQMSRYYEDAVELARLLTAWAATLKNTHRHFVVCSGGGPGIMEAANRGAKLAGGKSIGLTISLPKEEAPNPYISSELCFEFHYFFMRKFWFAYPAKALVIFPGGFGTMDELMEILTLLQTGKIKKKMTILLYGREYWQEILNFPALVRHGMISPEDVNLFQVADTPADAFKILKAGLIKNYHLDE